MCVPDSSPHSRDESKGKARAAILAGEGRILPLKQWARFYQITLMPLYRLNF